VELLPVDVAGSVVEELVVKVALVDLTPRNGLVDLDLLFACPVEEDEEESWLKLCLWLLPPVLWSTEDCLVGGGPVTETDLC